MRERGKGREQGNESEQGWPRVRLNHNDVTTEGYNEKGGYETPSVSYPPYIYCGFPRKTAPV
jgi:hypothetical protein